MHELRHTQATMLLGKGIDIKTVQARLGHARASHTLDMYAHTIPANDKDAASLMGDLTAHDPRPKARLISIEEYEAKTRRGKRGTTARTEAIARPNLNTLP